jgi:hypothetical protein
MPSPLQELKLDDLRFQRLVDQARKAIITFCPEWTDYNISDPGITLIEMFAWMTSVYSYRMNQIPDKNYIKFLELIGAGAVPQPPAQATTELFFSFFSPLPPAGAEQEGEAAIKISDYTQVATRRVDGQERELIFTTDNSRPLIVRSPELVAVRRDFGKGKFFDRGHKTELAGQPESAFYPFQSPPQAEDAFYLKLNSTPRPGGYLLRLDLEFDPALVVADSATDAAALAWECVTTPEAEADPTWSALTVEEDTTQGFSRNGAITLRLPANIAPVAVHGAEEACWLRGRYQGPASPPAGPYITGLQLTVLDAGQEQPGTIADRNALLLPPEIGTLETQEAVSIVPVAETAPENAAVRLVRWRQQGLYLFQAPLSDQDEVLPPQANDAFCLEFGTDIRGYSLQLDFVLRVPETTSRLLPGDGRHSSSLILECGVGTQAGQAVWRRITPEEDNTWGLTQNNAGGIRLQLPLDMKPTSYRGRAAYWLRFRLPDSPDIQKVYGRSPYVTAVQVKALGITLPATHTAFAAGETLGVSNGKPGQSFFMPNRPILDLDPALEEFIQVQEELPGGGSSDVSWSRVANFADSSAFDRHYTLDIATGEVSFGPSLRQPDGTARQHGAIPLLGCKIRVTRYRVGGGAVGNVPLGSLRVVKRPIPGVNVTNRVPATGGRDAESLDAARLRVQEDLRSQYRAVTALDYESLAADCPGVSRIRCKRHDEARIRLGTVELLIVPQLDSDPAAHGLELLAQLAVTLPLRNQVKARVAPYQLLGIVLEAQEPDYRVVKIKARVLGETSSSLDTIRTNVANALAQYVTPTSWEWGQSLYQSEIYSKIQSVAGVRHVVEIEMAYIELSPAEAREALERGKHTFTWTPAENGRIETPADGLLCLIAPEIEVTRDDT